MMQEVMLLFLLWLKYKKWGDTHHIELIIGQGINEMQYRKILVHYDASKTSEKALKRATEIAKINHPVIFIIHVIPEVPVSSRQIAKLRTSDKGEILITHSIKEVYDKMESDINLIIKEKKRGCSNDQINIESIVKIG